MTDRNKSSEIEKTVCAFSNASGCTLFLGIDDEGKTVGIDKEARRSYDADMGEAITRNTDAVRKRLRERLNDNQCFEIDVTELFNCVVVVVTVAPGSVVNYLTNSKQSYILRGATSQSMSPENVLARRRTQFEY